MTALVEATLRRHRAVTIAALAVMTLLAWGWMFAGAGMGMDPMVSLSPFAAGGQAMSGMAHAAPWTVVRFALIFSMWWSMMVAMMLPSAAPTILLYARAATNAGSTVRPATGTFLLGYLLAWGVFSMLATALQALLERIGLLAQMEMVSRDHLLSAAILVLAGVYQLSPWKEACLRHCRSPVHFISRHFRQGRAGALRMGLIHGTVCVGCCWMLMLLLFVGGVMNLAWIALLTLLVAAEKLLPQGRWLGKALGLACLGWGMLLIAHG